MDRNAEKPQLTASELVGESWSFMRSHAGPLASAAAFPLVLSLALGVISVAATSAGVPTTLVDWGVLLLGVIPWTIFGIAWHRLVLMDEPASMSLTWSRNHTRFALFLLVWTIPWLLDSQQDPESDVGWLSLLAIPGWIALVYVEVRFSLFLPAAAIGEPLSPSEAWSKSRGYGGALFWSGFLAGLLGILLNIPFIIAIWLLVQNESVLAELLVVPVSCAAELVFEALGVGALSFAYKIIHFRESAAQRMDEFER